MQLLTPEMKNPSWPQELVGVLERPRPGAGDGVLHAVDLSGDRCMQS